MIAKDCQHCRAALIARTELRKSCLCASNGQVTAWEGESTHTSLGGGQYTVGGGRNLPSVSITCSCAPKVVAAAQGATNKQSDKQAVNGADECPGLGPVRDGSCRLNVLLDITECTLWRYIDDVESKHKPACIRMQSSNQSEHRKVTRTVLSRYQLSSNRIGLILASQTNICM